MRFEVWIILTLARLLDLSIDKFKAVFCKQPMRVEDKDSIRINLMQDELRKLESELLTLKVQLKNNEFNRINQGNLRKIRDSIIRLG